ncbi:MAG: hypothetical protein Q7T78_21470 [Rhodoferax sp.]|nr:hypothetical protein [Rhodoferax sp.]
MPATKVYLTKRQPTQVGVFVFGIQMKILAVILSSWLLVACGGGGGSSVTVTASVATGNFTVSGTAATGKALAGAIINAKCVVGTGSATTNADGTYSLVVLGGKLPCLLQITDPADGSKLHTVATGNGISMTANMTPLTEMLVARLLRNDPFRFFSDFDAVVAASTITSTAVLAAQTDVGTILIGTVDTSSLGDFIATALKAATSDNLSGGDAQDRMLDALGGKISGAQLVQLVSALARIPNTADFKQVLLDLGIH